MSTKQAKNQTTPPAADQPRIEAIRERFQRERPGPEALVESGDAPPTVPGPQFFAVRRLVRALKEERERQGLSLTAAAERSGVERAMISKLENGRILNPTLETLYRYALALGKDLALHLEDLSMSKSTR